MPSWVFPYVGTQCWGHWSEGPARRPFGFCEACLLIGSVARRHTGYVLPWHKPREEPQGPVAEEAGTGGDIGSTCCREVLQCLPHLVPSRLVPVQSSFASPLLLAVSLKGIQTALSNSGPWMWNVFLPDLPIIGLFSGVTSQANLNSSSLPCSAWASRAAASAVPDCSSQSHVWCQNTHKDKQPWADISPRRPSQQRVSRPLA